MPHWYTTCLTTRGVTQGIRTPHASLVYDLPQELLVLLFSQTQHTGKINLKGGKVENGNFTLLVVQSFSLQFVGGMIRPSLL